MDRCEARRSRAHLLISAADAVRTPEQYRFVSLSFVDRFADELWPRVHLPEPADAVQRISRVMLRPTLILILLVFVAVSSLGQPQPVPALVSFQAADGATVCGLDYGKGKRGVVLVHGGQFAKESWSRQAQTLARSGYRVLAIDLRGKGCSNGPGDNDLLKAPLEKDVLAAVRYLRKNGTKKVSVVGASLGGWASAGAAIIASSGEILSIVTLGGLVNREDPSKINVPLTVITTRDDANSAGPRLPKIEAEFARVPQKNKNLIIFEGTAHAQFMFDADIGEDVMRAILDFLRKTNR